MNRRLGVLLSMGAGIVLLAGAAGAQDRSDVSDRTAPNVLKGDTYVGAQVGIDFIGDTNFKCRCESRQSDFLLYGGRVGHFFTDHLALEGTYHWVDLHPGFYDATLGLMWDFTPSIPGWNTYVGIGGGTEHVAGQGEGLAYLSFGSEYRFNRVVGARFERHDVPAFEGAAGGRGRTIEEQLRLERQRRIVDGIETGRSDRCIRTAPGKQEILRMREPPIGSQDREQLR